jgi:methyl-accepting chemotaxis protein
MSALRLCFVLALGQCLLAAVVGCSTVQRFTPREESKVRAAQLQELQLKVMRFADDYSGRISDPIVHLNIQTTPAEVRLRAHNWRVSQATAAYTIASGANPTINALDMIVLATLSRMVVEDRLLADYGERGRSLLDAHRSLEQQSWSLVDGVLNADQSKEVLAAIDRWRAENPTTRSVAQVRFADFAALELRRGTQQQQQGNNSLFGFIGLDPLSNLDPAVREIEQTRQLAERTIYYLQRAPGLLDMEVERLVYQLAAMPESERTLTNIDRLSLAAEAIGTLSNRAPDIIASERQAIISQLTAALHTEQDRLQPLLVSLRDVLNAGTQTSQSLTGTVTALDAFVARFQPDRPQPADPATPKRPFDITEYAATARDLAAAAERVQSLLAQLDESSKGVESVTRVARQEVNGIIDHAFRLALLLILALGFTAVSCALLYRYWSRRLPPVRMAGVPPVT